MIYQTDFNLLLGEWRNLEDKAKMHKRSLVYRSFMQIVEQLGIGEASFELLDRYIHPEVKKALKVEYFSFQNFLRVRANQHGFYSTNPHNKLTLTPEEIRYSFPGLYKILNPT